jgi:hypothetical protein
VSGQSKRNPFHELGLPVDTSVADVVRKGQELVELAATDEEARNARWAMRELTTHPRDRARHELLEVPDTNYQDDVWDRFERRHRRNPVDLDALARDAQPLRSTDFDVRAILGLLLDDLLAPPAADIDLAVRNAPQPQPFGPSPIEVSDVIFG